MHAYIRNILKQKAALIMVGPGTGVAPFRSLLQEYPDKWQKMLFFGCRGVDRDFYFEDEWEALMSDGNLEFFAAISRDSRGRLVYKMLSNILTSIYRITPCVACI